MILSFEQHELYGPGAQKQVAYQESVRIIPGSKTAYEARMIRDPGK